MILEQGEKIHIIERRLFADDVRRHFVGEVLKCTELAFRAIGYSWVFDPMNGRFVKKIEKRERICALDYRLTINVISPAANIEAAGYVTDPQKGLLVTDRKNFSLEINEFGPQR